MAVENLTEVLNVLNIPFYNKPDFWISVIIGGLGVGFSFFAFLEARAAKEAASKLAETVKIQTVVIEFTEIMQRLDKLDYSLTFFQARDLLSEVSRRCRRLIAPFQEENDLKTICESLKTSLTVAKSQLDLLIPSSGDETPNSIYFGMQSSLGDITNHVAEILGLLEKRSFKN
ncbi:MULTISPECIES: hypothetical protein [unclassified Acinetobacter]|uniref:hypothetical protein n=1 Tax=unclassified Acinetobacter TaxID=196816 RepID=UPI0015D3B4D3|nr:MULTISPECIES: hypothetical protein [unclassified Acinetobacter]